MKLDCGAVRIMTKPIDANCVDEESVFERATWAKNRRNARTVCSSAAHLVLLRRRQSLLQPNRLLKEVRQSGVSPGLEHATLVEKDLILD